MSLCEEHRPEEMIIICGAFTSGRAQFSALGVEPLGKTSRRLSHLCDVLQEMEWKIGDPEAWHSRDPRQPGSRTCAPILSESPALIH